LRCLIHQGSIELGGPLFGQTIQWTINNVEGELNGAERNVAFIARPSFLGPSARLSVILNASQEKPLQAELKSANLDSVFSVIGSTESALWRGSRLDAHIESNGREMSRFTLTIDRLTVPALPDAFVHGTLQITTASVQGILHFEGLVSSMSLRGQWSRRRQGWEGSASIEQYSPEVVSIFSKNRWARALHSPGSLQITASRRGAQPYRYTVSGSSFTFYGSRFLVRTWSASEDGSGADVIVNAQTPGDEGEVLVRWTQMTGESVGHVVVDISSVTVGDVFDVFALHTKHPIGIEPWTIQEGHYEGPVDADGRVIIDQAELTLANLKIATSGEMDFSTVPAQGHFVGTMTDVNLKPVLESFWANARLSGTANYEFDIRFSTGILWLQTLEGRVSVQCRDGFIKAGKVLYRIAGLLNIPQLIIPNGRAKTTSDGFPYQSALADLIVHLGVVDCQNLKIHTENMHIGAKGQVNLPTQSVDARIEFQFMNVLKNTLSAIPLVKRVVSPDTGLIRIPIHVRGNLENPDVD
jgi:hypothetical protein